MTRGAHSGGPSDFDRVGAGVGGVDRKSLDDDIFLAAGGKVQDALGTAAVRPDNNGFTRVRGYRDRRGPGCAARNGIDKLFGVCAGTNLKSVTRFQKTYALLNGGDWRRQCAEIHSRT